MARKKVRFKKQFGPTDGWREGKPFVWHTVEMLCHPAWRTMPINTRLVLERLEIEHALHNGLENGRLRVSYDQFIEHGVTNSPKAVVAAWKDANKRGFLKTPQSGWKLKGAGNLYELTYLPTTRKNEHGALEHVAPTDEWRRTAQKIQILASSRGRNVLPPEEESDGSDGGTTTRKPLKSLSSPLLPPEEVTIW